MSLPLPSIPPDAKVSLLIDETNGSWKDEEVRQMFLPHEVKKILSVALSTRLPQDNLIWSKTPSGIFSTRSAYRLLANEASASSPSSSITIGETNQSAYGHVIGDILAQATPFSSFEFCYVNQSCNRVADALAKRAKSSLDLQV